MEKPHCYTFQETENSNVVTLTLKMLMKKIMKNRMVHHPEINNKLDHIGLCVLVHVFTIAFY